jgi:hypothetical protein
VETQPLSASAAGSFVGTRWLSAAAASTGIRIANPGRKLVEYRITFFAPDSSILYQLKGPQLKPGEDTLVDVAQLREQRIPDPQRRIMPATVEEGTFEVEVPDASGGMLFAAAANTAADPASTAQAMLLSCCGRVSPEVHPYPLWVFTGGSELETVYVANTCTNQKLKTGAWWWTDDPIIAAVDSLGNVYGFEAGLTIVDAEVELYLGGFVCGEHWFETLYDPVNVTPVVSIQGNRGYVYVGHDPEMISHNALFGSGIPSDGKYTWSSPDDNISFDYPAAATVHVTATSYTGLTNDTQILLYYSANDQAADPASVSVTKRIFKFLQQYGAIGPDVTTCADPNPFGYKLNVRYDVYASPNAQLVAGEPRVSTTEQVSQTSFVVNGISVNPFGDVQTGSGTLDTDSRVNDTLGLCNDSALPDGLDSTLDQYLFVGGIFVRHNTNHLLTSTATVTNLGPTN